MQLDEILGGVTDTFAYMW
ncbi:hypothetical protein BLA29_015567 [Euroglyphus maynei]|uniref:Uncharacterized protein n=1 Tax=Euroglyphus maynei TaxID=6958 RepID=A0A1Y3BTR8_EURMA|nr:hypothetical protein BLA29_015567 [Euroglyphus maynei]